MASYLGTQVSTVVLGILFILPGIVKTVRLNTTLYREMVSFDVSLFYPLPIALAQNLQKFHGSIPISSLGFPT
ncbi:hypothetical protein CLF_106277 [Clonorchis sinensis]|uniref:Uncharacterized protein n=1 Tax=Clonorchis sinensis TaxID=79923 RepID=G7YPU3_CLOSI|nr:hypothetical protein CLF_106277 [Clonorchis sinensis]